MTKRTSRPLLNRLLSGREGLAPPDQEDVLAVVLAGSAPPRTVWSLPSFRFAMAAAVVALVAGVVTIAARPSADEIFTPRGAPTFAFELSCLTGGSPGPCRAGSTLAFRVDTSTPGSFSALTLTNSGDALWFFHDLPTTGGVLERAPVLPAGLSGTVTVLGVLTEGPVDKQTLRAQLQRGDPSLSIVRRTLVVEP